MKHTPNWVISLILLISIATGCKMNQNQEQALFVLGQRPEITSGIPDLTKGEGPDPEKVSGPHHLLSSSCRAWVARDENGSAENSRQILLTYVQSDKPAWRSLRKGDVILGINGEYFSGDPIDQFRRGQSNAIKTEGSFDVILWRKGWEKERIVTVDLGYKTLDFTKGDTPGTACDWNLGPTGARGWMQGRYNESYEARQILITNVAKGSPADGILKKGDVILGLDGKKFDSDCRRAFGRALTKAETEEGQGKLNLRRWRNGKTTDVIIKIPVMGSYSKTTPWNCEKTKKILANACRYIVEKDIINKGNKDKPTEKTLAALGLLSTGKKEHLELARKFIYQLIEEVETANKAGEKLPSWGHKSWGWGYYNLLLTEYYLLTKDPKVLPAIEIYSDSIALGQSGVGSWGHGMAWGHGKLGGYGAMNQAGTICWMSLILAKRCGVTSPEIEKAIARGKIYLDHFIDRQSVPYGDNIIIKDARLHDDNGKSSAAACAYSMLDDKCGTDFFSKMTIASWAVREFGHTGNMWSMLWGPLGAERAGQEACSAFLLQQSWYFDMDRQWDGGFTYNGKMGYRSGFDYETGVTTGSAENQYAGWDMTGCRILMYTLPLKLLTISGKDCLTVPTPENEIAELIEAGRPAPASIEFHAGNISFLKDKYADTSPEELIKLLGSWSPIVRNQAANSLAKRDGDYIDELRKMLKSRNRFARYGACMAIGYLAMNGEADGIAEDIIPLLKTDDEAQFTYAALALGETKDKKAVDLLLKLAASEFPDDQNDYHLRIIATALFKRGGALNRSIDGVDRSLLLPAVARLMQCKGGAARDFTARAVIPKLTFQEVSQIWDVLSHSLNNYALTEVGSGTAGQGEIAETFAKFKIKEAMPLLWEHVTKQKGHGSQKRHQKLLSFVKSYGINAKELLPEMEQYLEAIKRKEERDTHFCTTLAPHLESAIKAIKETTDNPELKSIKENLK